MKTQQFNNEPKSDNNYNDRLSLALLHLSGVLPVFFISMLIYNRKKESIKEMPDHFRAVIAFQSVVFLIWFLGFVGFILSGDSTVPYGILIVSVIFSAINALRVLNNQSYKYPFHFRFRNKMTNLNSI